MKKLLSLLMALTLLTLSLASCAEPAPAEEASESPADTETADTEAPAEESAEPVTIEYWHSGIDEVAVALAEEQASTFTAMYPHITVDLSATGDVGEVETKLNAAVLSDTFPDVLGAALAIIPSRGSLGDLEMLQPYIDEWADKDDILDSAYEAGMYEGEVYAISTSPTPYVNVYRKDLFVEAGLDPEDPPQTWEEILEVAEQLTIRDESGTVIQAGFSMPALDTALVFSEPFMRNAGSTVIDEVNFLPYYNDEGAIAAYDFFGQIAQMNVSIPYNFQKYDEDPFLNGRAAIGAVSSTPLKQYLTDNPDMIENIGYIEAFMPEGGEDEYMFCGHTLFAMGASGDAKDQSWMFMQHLLSVDMLTLYNETHGSAPVRESMQEGFFAVDENYSAAVNYSVSHGKPKSAVSWNAVANKHISVAFEEVINGAKTAEQALNDANEAIIAEIG